MSYIRLAIANESRSYQQAVAGVLNAFRPEVEVRLVDWMSLDDEIITLRPRMVISSHITPFAASNVPFWVEMYPNDGSVSRIGRDGEVEVVENLEVSDLLDLLDEVIARSDYESESNPVDAARATRRK